MKAAPKQPRRAAALFRILAVVDASLLLYVAVQYDWFRIDITRHFDSGGLAALIFLPLHWAEVILARLLFAAACWVVGVAIIREFRGRQDAPRWQAAVASPLLFLTGTLALKGWTAAALPVVKDPYLGYLDRLTVYVGLTSPVDVLAYMDRELGMRSWSTGSAGALLVTALLAMYLCEKYLLAYWRIRWIVPVVPLLAVGWLAWHIWVGERSERQFVASRQWQLLAEPQTWPQALAACEQVGPGWGLARPVEASLYLARGAAAGPSESVTTWTSLITTDGGSAGVVARSSPLSGGAVLKAPRACEQGGHTESTADAFERLRPWVCRHSARSPLQYERHDMNLVHAVSETRVEQPTARALCVQPVATAGALDRHGRTLSKDEREMTRAADFTALIAQRCATPVLSDRMICFAFAPDQPSSPETGVERLMRSMCDLGQTGGACLDYALLLDRRGSEVDRAARYRLKACARGYAAACPSVGQPFALPVPGAEATTGK